MVVYAAAKKSARLSFVIAQTAAKYGPQVVGELHGVLYFHLVARFSQVLVKVPAGRLAVTRSGMFGDNGVNQGQVFYR